MTDDVVKSTDGGHPMGEVKCTIVGNVAILTMSREGRANAWGADMAKSLAAQLTELADNDSIRACVLTGEGKNFCSGADISNEDSHKVHSAGEFLKRMKPFKHYGFDQLEDFRKPVVAAVKGNAIGAGLMLPIHCDVILVGESVKFILPQARIGIIPGSGGLTRLAQWVGRGRATEIAMSGRPVRSEEAIAIGLATAAYPDDEVLNEAVSYASTLAAMPPLALWATKESIRVGYNSSGYQSAALLDGYRSGMLQMTRDSDEAHLAWRERREPTYEIR